MVGAIAVALLFVAVPQVETQAEPEKILRVPAEYTTIQAAIDAAFDGDTVLVADGTYTGLGNKDLDFGGKAITVKSENGGANCIIDCENSGRGFYFHSGETAASILDGFTVRNGRVLDYGAIRCDGSSPTITNCIVTSNSSNFLAGGILCNIGSNPVISNCVVTNNHARVGGGGIYCFESNPTVVNCLIAGNTAEYYGAGFYCGWKATAVVTNCTITNNTANINGGGVFCNLTSNLTLNNTIVWANAAVNGNEIYTWGSSSFVTLNYCDYADNTIDPNNIAGLGTVTPNNCISEDPLFVGSDPFDYHLQEGSPCVDAGSNALVPAGVTTDLDGNPRIVADVVDIGTYEYQVPDTTPPEITINSPVEGAQYNWTDTITVDFAVEDPESGIKAAVARIDCHPVENGQDILASDLGYGNHFMLVKATNGAGLESEKFIIFHVRCEPTDMEFVILDYVEEGLITDEGVGQSLIAKVQKIDLHTSIGDIKSAIGKLGAFINFVDAQAGKKIDSSIVPSLRNWANYSISTLATVPELPRTLTYALEPGAHIDFTLLDGSFISTTVEGRFTYLFEATEDPNTIGFTATEMTLQCEPFIFGEDTIAFRIVESAEGFTTGTIDLLTGEVRGNFIGNVIWDINGVAIETFVLEMAQVGVQQWPDIYTASMIMYGQGTVPEGVPVFGAARVELCGRTVYQAEPEKYDINLHIHDAQYGYKRPPLTEKEEKDPGAFTVANKNDTDGDGDIDNKDEEVKKGKLGREEVDTMKLWMEVTPAPSDPNPVVILSVAGADASKVRVWKERWKGKGNEVDLPATIPAAQIPTRKKPLWVEVIDKSTKIGKESIRLIASYKEKSDWVAATAVWAKVTYWYDNNATPTAADEKEKYDRLVAGLTADDPPKERFVKVYQSGFGLREIPLKPPPGPDILKKPWPGVNNVIGIEFEVFPEGIEKMGKYVAFDITRQKCTKAWKKRGNRRWREMEKEACKFPPDDGQDNEKPNDDRTHKDESKKPDSKRKMYVCDGPGPPSSVAFADYCVARGNFLEFMRVRVDRPTAKRPRKHVVKDDYPSRCSDKFKWCVRHYLKRGPRKKKGAKRLWERVGVDPANPTETNHNCVIGNTHKPIDDPLP